MSARPSKNVQGNCRMWWEMCPRVRQRKKLSKQMLHNHQLSQIFHLVNEGPERGEDLFEGSLRLRDLQKAQMDLENLLHQGVVTKI